MITAKPSGVVNVAGARTRLWEHKGPAADLKAAYDAAVKFGWQQLCFVDDGEQSYMLLARTPAYPAIPLPAYQDPVHAKLLASV